MEKSPFIVFVLVALAALLMALVSYAFGNAVGVQISLMLSGLLLFLYALLRIAYDLVPEKFIKSERQGRS